MDLSVKKAVGKLKAFTLAEVLIVLTVIGVIATITMPQLVGGVDESQYKAGLKKAYTTIANVVSVHKADDKMPTTGKDTTALLEFFQALNDNLEVEGYSTAPTNDTIDSGAKVTTSDIKEALSYGGVTFGDTSGDTLTGATAAAANTWSPWIIAADDMAFSVITNNSTTCTDRGAINKASVAQSTAVANACLIVVVDVNGLRKGPNRLESQTVAAGVKLQKLKGDRYYIFIAKNGVAKGSEDTTVTGRLLAGQK